MTRKEKAMVDRILANPTITGKEAARGIFNASTDRSLEVQASRVLRKDEVMNYLKDHAKEAEQGLIEVANYSRDFGRAGNPAFASVARSAYDSILDRVHGKAKQSLDVTSTSVSFTIDLTGADE